MNDPTGQGIRWTEVVAGLGDAIERLELFAAEGCTTEADYLTRARGAGAVLVSGAGVEMKVKPASRPPSAPARPPPPTSALARKKKVLAPSKCATDYIPLKHALEDETRSTALLELIMSTDDLASLLKQMKTSTLASCLDRARRWESSSDAARMDGDFRSEDTNWRHRRSRC